MCINLGMILSSLDIFCHSNDLFTHLHFLPGPNYSIWSPENMFPHYFAPMYPYFIGGWWQNLKSCLFGTLWKCARIHPRNSLPSWCYKYQDIPGRVVSHSGTVRTEEIRSDLFNSCIDAQILRSTIWPKISAWIDTSRPFSPSLMLLSWSVARRW